MSDKIPVRRDPIPDGRATRVGEGDKMTTAISIAHHLALRLEAEEFKGIGDTREAARARAAAKAGVSESYLTRLVYRHATMRDVSGQVLLTLQRWADTLETSAARADAHRKAIHDEISSRPVALAEGAGAPEGRPSAPLHHPRPRDTAKEPAADASQGR